MDRFISGEKHFLRYLRGFIVVPHQPVNQIECRFLVPAHQDFEGIGVTLLDAFDAFRVTYSFREHGTKYD
jgi:hypothetical protein